MMGSKMAESKTIGAKSEEFQGIKAPAVCPLCEGTGWKTVASRAKAGGSAKCLTLRLDGEEAAGWKRE